METTQKYRAKNRTASSIMYLLMAFPLGLIYFVLLVVGVALGLSTLIVWVGIPILLLTLAGARGMAALERDLAEHMLHIPMPHVQRVLRPDRSWRAWAVDSLRDSLTWRSLIYILIKFPLGIITFTLALVLPIVALAFLLYPLIYLLNTYIDAILLTNGVHVGVDSWWPFFVTIDGHFNLTMFFRSFIGTPIGILGWYMSTQLLNGLAYGLGTFARAMLNPDLSEQAMPKSEGYQTERYQAAPMQQMQYHPAD